MIESSRRPNCWAFVIDQLGLSNGEAYVDPPTLEAVERDFYIVDRNNAAEAEAIGFFEEGENTITHAGLVNGSLSEIANALPLKGEWIRTLSVDEIKAHFEKDPNMAPLDYVLLKRRES